MAGYQEYYNGFYRELAQIDARHNDVRKIADLIPPLSQGAMVLDIGCGHGRVAQHFVGAGCRVFGMELNQEALASLREKGIEPVSHDMTQPFDLPHKFDLVLLLDVLEHVFDPVSLLEEACRSLADGGALIVSVPLYFDLRDRLRILCTGSIISYDNRCYGGELFRRFRSFNYDHIRFFSHRDVEEMITLAQMEIEQARYVPMYGFSLLEKLLLRVIANRFTVRLFPSLLAHSMVVRLRKR